MRAGKTGGTPQGGGTSARHLRGGARPLMIKPWSREKGCAMAEFIIRPHGRLHDWIADELGYFREEGLEYRLVGDEERENRPKEVDPATGALCDVRSGAYEMYQQGAGS